MTETTKSSPDMCDGCMCFREKWGLCVIYYDIPKKYKDEGKCPHYTNKDEHVAYQKKETKYD